MCFSNLFLIVVVMVVGRGGALNMRWNVKRLVQVHVLVLWICGSEVLRVLMKYTRRVGVVILDILLRYSMVCYSTLYLCFNSLSVFYTLLRIPTLKVVSEVWRRYDE